MVTYMLKDWSMMVKNLRLPWSRSVETSSEVSSAVVFKNTFDGIEILRIHAGNIFHEKMDRAPHEVSIQEFPDSRHVDKET